MSTPALRPRSASEIVDAAFQILRAHYGQFVMCAAVAYAPLLLVQLVLLGDPSRVIAAGPSAVTAALQATWLATSLLSWLTVSLMSAVLVVCASQAYLGEEVDAGAAVRRVLPQAPRVIGVALVRYLLIMLGVLAFLVGAFYVVARYFAVVPAVVLEDNGVGAALARSSQLSRGRKRHVLNTLGLVGVIYLVLYIGLWMATALVGNFTMQLVARSVLTILLYPVVAITEALLYYDARIQSEGLDVELMAGALAPAPAGGAR